MANINAKQHCNYNLQGLCAGSFRPLDERAAFIHWQIHALGGTEV